MQIRRVYGNGGYSKEDGQESKRKIKFPWQQRQSEGQDLKERAINLSKWGINIALALPLVSNEGRTFKNYSETN